MIGTKKTIAALLISALCIVTVQAQGIHQAVRQGDLASEAKQNEVIRLLK